MLSTLPAYSRVLANWVNVIGVTTPVGDLVYSFRSDPAVLPDLVCSLEALETPTSPSGLLERSLAKYGHTFECAVSVLRSRPGTRISSLCTRQDFMTVDAKLVLLVYEVFLSYAYRRDSRHRAEVLRRLRGMGIASVAGFTALELGSLVDRFLTEWGSSPLLFLNAAADWGVHECFNLVQLASFTVHGHGRPGLQMLEQDADSPTDEQVLEDSDSVDTFRKSCFEKFDRAAYSAYTPKKSISRSPSRSGSKLLSVHFGAQGSSSCGSRGQSSPSAAARLNRPIMSSSFPHGHIVPQLQDLRKSVLRGSNQSIQATDDLCDAISSRFAELNVEAAVSSASGDIAVRSAIGDDNGRRAPGRAAATSAATQTPTEIEKMRPSRMHARAIWFVDYAALVPTYGLDVGAGNLSSQGSAAVPVLLPGFQRMLCHPSSMSFHAKRYALAEDGTRCIVSILEWTAQRTADGPSAASGFSGLLPGILRRISIGSLDILRRAGYELQDVVLPHVSLPAVLAIPTVPVQAPSTPGLQASDRYFELTAEQIAYLRFTYEDLGVGGSDFQEVSQQLSRVLGVAPGIYSVHACSAVKCGAPLSDVWEAASDS